MSGCGRLGDAELVGDEDNADALLEEVAVSLRWEVGDRIAQPLEDLQPL
jgi:hypothetical protein